MSYSQTCSRNQTHPSGSDRPLLAWRAPALWIHVCAFDAKWRIRGYRNRFWFQNTGSHQKLSRPSRCSGDCRGNGTRRSTTQEPLSCSLSISPCTWDSSPSYRRWKWRPRFWIEFRWIAGEFWCDCLNSPTEQQQRHMTLQGEERWKCKSALYRKGWLWYCINDLTRIKLSEKPVKISSSFPLEKRRKFLLRHTRTGNWSNPASDHHEFIL